MKFDWYLISISCLILSFAAFMISFTILGYNYKEAKDEFCRFQGFDYYNVGSQRGGYCENEKSISNSDVECDIKWIKVGRCYWVEPKTVVEVGE